MRQTAEETGLVNKSPAHYQRIREYLDGQGLTLVSRMDTINPGRALVLVSEGQYDIDIVIANSLTPERIPSQLTGLTVPNPEVILLNCGAEYLGAVIFGGRVVRSDIIPTKGPYDIQQVDIDRQTVFKMPNRKPTALDELVQQLRRYLRV